MLNVSPETGPAARVAVRRRSAATALTLQALVVVATSSLVGLAVNYPRLTSGELLAVVEGAPGARKHHEFIAVSRAENAYRNGDVIFVDVRPTARFQAAHVPGAINLPVDKFDQTFARVSAWFPAETVVILYGERGKIDVLYEVEDALDLAGCENRRLLRDGFEAWQQRGLLFGQPKLTPAAVFCVAMRRPYDLPTEVLSRLFRGPDSVNCKLAYLYHGFLGVANQKPQPARTTATATKVTGIGCIPNTVSGPTARAITTTAPLLTT